MHIVVLFALLVTLSFAFDPVFVDELEDLVLNKEDEQELDKLDDDKYMKRAEKKQKLDEILARQPDNIKELYKKEVENKRLKHQNKIQKKIAEAFDAQVKNYWEKIEQISNNMTISEKEASILKKELKHNLTPQQRKSLDD